MVFYRRPKVLTLIALLVISFISTPAWADKVLFAPKNVLSGKLNGMQGGVVSFSTPDSPNVKIPVNKVIKMVTRKPVVIVMKDGSRLIGRILAGWEKGKFGVRLSKASRQRQQPVFSWTEVEAINPPDKKWFGDASIGGSSQTGNTERTSFSIAGSGALKLKEDLFSLKFLYNFAEENDRVTARNTYGAFKFEHNFNADWYWLLSTELLNDKFKDLNLRAILGPGIGYTVWNDAEKVLKLEGGISYFSEDLRLGMDDRWFTARLAANFSYQIFEWLQFLNQVLMYPNVEELEDFKLRNEATIVTTLGNGWALKLSNILEHNSRPPAGVQKDDTTWLYSVQYSF